MATKSYTTIIRPEFDNSSLQKMKKQLSGLGSVLKAASSTKAMVGASSLIAAYWLATSNSLQKSNEELTKFLSYTDRISTLSGDLPNLKPSEIALLTSAMEISGIAAEEQDRIFRSLQDQIKEGKIVKGKDQSMADVLGGLQKLWQQGDEKEKAKIEDTLGLRGKKSSEFLQGDIFKDIDKLILSVGKSMGAKNLEESRALLTKKLDKVFIKGSNLEGEQARLKAEQELKQTIAVAGVVDIDKIRKQADIQEMRDLETIAFLKNYEALVNTQIAKDRAMFIFLRLVDNLVDPLIKRVGGLQNIDKLSIAGLLTEVLKEVLLGLRDVFISIGQSIVASILPKKWLKAPEIKKNENKQNENQKVRDQRGK